MIDVARYARRLVRQKPLANMVFEELRPGAEFDSDDAIIAAYDTFGNGSHNASGSCRRAQTTIRRWTSDRAFTG